MAQIKGLMNSWFQLQGDWSSSKQLQLSQPYQSAKKGPIKDLAYLKTGIRDYREKEKERVSGFGDHRIQRFCELYVGNCSLKDKDLVRKVTCILSNVVYFDLT